MLKPIPQNTSWPSGDCINVATLRISPGEVEAAVGCELAHGVEAGLGAWRAVGVKTPGGVIIELVQYTESPTPDVFTLRVEPGAPVGEALDEVLLGLGLSRSHVVWLSASIEG